MRCESILYELLLYKKIRISCMLNAYGAIYPRWPIYRWPLLTIIQVSHRALFHQVFGINTVFDCMLLLDLSVIIPSGITSLGFSM